MEEGETQLVHMDGPLELTYNVVFPPTSTTQLKFMLKFARLQMVFVEKHPGCFRSPSFLLEMR